MQFAKQQSDFRHGGAREDTEHSWVFAKTRFEMLAEGGMLLVHSRLEKDQARQVHPDFARKFKGSQRSKRSVLSRNELQQGLSEAQVCNRTCCKIIL